MDEVRAEVKPTARYGWEIGIYEPRDEFFLVPYLGQPWLFWRPWKFWAMNLARRKVRKRQRQRDRLKSPPLRIGDG